MCRDKKAFVEAEVLRLLQAVEAIHRAEMETVSDNNACETMRLAYCVLFKSYAVAAVDHMKTVIATAEGVSPEYEKEVRSRIEKGFLDALTRESPLSDPIVPEDWVEKFEEDYREGRES